MARNLVRSPPSREWAAPTVRCICELLTYCPTHRNTNKPCLLPILGGSRFWLQLGWVLGLTPTWELLL